MTRRKRNVLVLFALIAAVFILFIYKGFKDIYTRYVFADAINVRDFLSEVKNDSKDKKAFENAFAAAIRDKKILYIPNGEYDLDGFVFTADMDLKIIGQDKRRTVLKNLGKIKVKQGISIENLTIANIAGSVAIAAEPYNYSRIILKNVRAYNSDTSFTDKSRANGFLYCQNPDIQKGIFNLIIKGCSFDGFASYAVSLRCAVNNGTISDNEFSNIGYDSNSNVCAILCGYQDEKNITTAPAKDLLISNNIISDIISSKGAMEESSEGHGILIYGSNIRIRGNTVRNLYGGGRKAENFDSGYDHEAIYIKASDSVIEGNTVINGCGGSGDGAITAKGRSNNTKIINNEIIGTFGSGIYTSADGVIISGNRITLGKGIYGIVSAGDGKLVEKNDIKIKGSNCKIGICVNGTSPGFKSVKNNKVITESGKSIYLTGSGEILNNNITAAGQYGIHTLKTAKVNIGGNDIRLRGDPVDSSSCIYSSGGSPDSSIDIYSNKLNYSRMNTPDHPSQCILLGGFKNISIRGNSISSSADRLVRISTEQPGSSAVVQKNKFVVTGDNADKRPQFVVNDKYGSYSISNNRFHTELKSDDFFRSVICKERSIYGNKFFN